MMGVSFMILDKIACVLIALFRLHDGESWETTRASNSSSPRRLLPYRTFNKLACCCICTSVCRGFAPISSVKFCSDRNTTGWLLRRQAGNPLETMYLRPRAAFMSRMARCISDGRQCRCVQSSQLSTRVPPCQGSFRPTCIACRLGTALVIIHHDLLLPYWKPECLL